MTSINLRKFKHTPPSYPWHYEKNRAELGWTYECIYRSHIVPNGMYLHGTNEWFDYMGDLIYEFMKDIEEVSSKKPEIRPYVIRSPIRAEKIRDKVPSRLNQM